MAQMLMPIYCTDCGSERLVDAAKNNVANYHKAHPRCNPCSKVGLTNLGSFKKGQTAWNKGAPRWWKSRTEIKKGQHISPDTEFKKGQKTYSDGKKLWLGSDYEYGKIHRWIRKMVGIPKVCIHCGVSEKLVWANKSRRYLYDVNDWIPLCISCHLRYDWVMRKEQYGCPK